jgi:DNA-binding SARP family transcriptional activator
VGFPGARAPLSWGGLGGAIPLRYSLRTLTLTPRLVAKPGEPERLRYSKQLAVVIYLCSRPRAQATREELLGLLWADSSEHDARSSLRQVLYQIRQATDPDLVVGDEVLRLRREDVDLDADGFRLHHAQGQLVSALALYEADFLASVGLAGAREFESWADGLRQQLAAERRQLLRTLISWTADAGRWSEGAKYAQLLIEADPGVLEPRLRRVELLALSGDAIRASGAAAEARAFAETIEGSRLSPEVEESIRRALAPVATRAGPAADVVPRHPEMAGRAAEFRIVVDKWKSALVGRGRTALITGESGIGKSRLARELIGRIRHDHCLVLQAACYPLEQSDPLAPFLDLLSAARSAPGLGAASPGCLSILSAVVPEVADRFRPAIEPVQLPVPPQTVGTALLEAFGAITEEIPLVLVVEDLHWAPPDTIEFVHRLARRAQSHHMLLLLTARDYGDVPGTTEALRALTATGAVKEVPLAPLDAAEVQQLLASIADLPDEASGRRLAAQLVQRTEGVPLYLLQVLKSLHDSGFLTERGGRWFLARELSGSAGDLAIPATVGAILESRLGTLGDRAAMVLAALAVWGRAAGTDTLSRLTALDAHDVDGALGALERRRLVVRDDALVRVAHDELAAAALRRTPRGTQVQLHERAARLARESARAGRTGDWMVAARYAALAGKAERAASDAAQAAASVERASGRAAGRETLSRALSTMPAEARTYLQMALQRVLAGKWSARRWLAERSGWPRRARYAAGAAVAALVVAASLIVPRVLHSRAEALPLGGGNLALGWGLPFHPDSVQALRVDADFVAERAPLESVPQGEREGFYPRFIRPDLRVAAFPCALPGVNPTAVCLRDLARGTTVTLAQFDDDAQPVGWLPDGSGLFVLRSYDSRRLGSTNGLVLLDSAGRLIQTIGRDSTALDAVWVAPTGERILAMREHQGMNEATLLSLGGTPLGVVDWCSRSVTAAWSPDGRRLACILENVHQLQIGDGRPGSWPTRVTFPDALQSGPVWSADGRYLAVSVGGRTPGVYVVDRSGMLEPRRVASYRSAPRLIGWLAPGAVAQLHKILVDPDTLHLTVGDTGMLRAHGLGPAGERLGAVPQVRWVSGDSTVARVDETGRVVADRAGSTYVVAAFGLGRIDDTAFVSVANAPAPPPLVLQEDFEQGLDTLRWRAFGDPAPRIAKRAGRGASTGFNNSGDYSHTSGIASRARLVVDRGLTIEYWASVPITRPVWQSVRVGLHSAPADSFVLGPGPPQPSWNVVAFALEAPVPNMARRQVMGLFTDASPSFNLVRLPDALGDGRWHRYRLVIYPGGEVRWFADGAELIPPGRASLGGQALWTLVVEGRSVGALAMVDDLKVWEGVALDPVQPAAPPLRRVPIGRRQR